jgi:predicted dehydrogenase
MSKSENLTPIRWGILACGGIAEKFAADVVAHVADGVVYACASRDLSKAQDFAQRHGAVKAFGGYQELADCEEVDVIYIATPHAQHHENTLMCLEAGKAVLCEKAFTINSAMLEEMVAKARTKNLFLMEAIWTRFHPAINQVKGIIESGRIGDIVHIVADFGFKAPYNETNRLFNPALTGGSLYDIGIYPLFISKLLLGNPKEIKAVATMAPTGVDMNCSMSLSYENGATASLFSTVMADTETVCVIYGTKGKIFINGRFHETKGFTVSVKGEEPEIFTTERLGFGYSYEAEEVQQCLREGKTESDKLPLQFSLELMELLCEIREQIELVYPQEIL